MPGIRATLEPVMCGLAAAFGLIAAAAAQSDGALEAEPALAPVASAQFHASYGEDLVWADDDDFEALLIAIRGLYEHGLDPSHYHLDALEAAREDRVRRDRLATDAWFSAAAHMVYGKLDPTTIEPDWTAAGREADLSGALRAALGEGSVAASLEELAPRQPTYRALRAELARLRELGEASHATISDGPALRLGASDERVRALNTRLIELGYLSGEVDDVFTEDTRLALMAYQISADLDDDGVAGAATVRALNRGVAAQVEQVRVNLERWRWLPDQLGARHVRANIAGFEVAAYENGVRVRTHLAIVGRLYRRTPVFSDQIEYVVFNPWWETPRNLAVQDKLPMFRSDPGAVERLGFQVLGENGAPLDASAVDWSALNASNFSYRLRQAPGPQNALGLVKIMFPNRHNVYIHDTPTRGLFSHRQRAFSSGCLRTQDPIGLSAWLLEGDSGDWDRARIDEAITSGAEVRADLATPVPVHILYLTVVNDESAGVRYLDDIYERDPAVLAGLRERAL